MQINLNLSPKTLMTIGKVGVGAVAVGGGFALGSKLVSSRYEYDLVGPRTTQLGTYGNIRLESDNEPQGKGFSNLLTVGGVVAAGAGGVLAMYPFQKMSALKLNMLQGGGAVLFAGAVGLIAGTFFTSPKFEGAKPVPNV